ncbi:DUF4240 domain-containing protein [Shewanella sp. ULN5]|uniref:DUF4240 domain-containing protein n=1 Tax=Shewanella sp. ULN5 TaxID=2994678 RepID=UPI00273F5B96|nr:DUF4240 domain-containing protein [Shewanella sp. ULN5]MDP5146988.1 DUF4240 domain-containing protein [Shewanella sp. ULN5]
MTETQFWQLVTRSHADQSSEQLALQLQQSLAELDNESLKAFDKIFGQQLRRSYTWSIWGAAYIITGCDSDYAFAEFRCFILSLGQQWYDKIVNEPDCLGDLAEWPLKDNYAYPFVEDYDLIAGKLYEDRTDEELPFVPSGSKTPAGKKFSTKPKILKQTYPKLSARFPF